MTGWNAQPVTSPETKGELQLLIKKYPQGNMSKHVHECALPSFALAFLCSRSFGAQVKPRRLARNQGPDPEVSL